MSDINDPRITGADLYLLEKWQHDSTLSDQEQVSQIFADYVELGIDGQQPYRDRVHERRVYYASRLTAVEREELARLRVPAVERSIPTCGLWLRTYYGPGSDAAFALLKESQILRLGDEPLVLDDASRYDFGDDWQRIFHRMPQLVHSNDSAQDYNEQKQLALQEALEEEEETPDPDLDPDYDPAVDAPLWEELSSNYQWACHTGCFMIVDETTLEGPESITEDRGKVYVAFYDDRGREVRWNRLSPFDAVEYAGIVDQAFIQDHGIWVNAWTGDDYTRDAVLGTASQEA